MKNLSFTSKRLYLFKREIPSDLSMNLVLNELKDEDRDIFILHSDEFLRGLYGWLHPAQYNPADFTDTKKRSALEVQLVIVEIYYRQCEILGIDFPQFWQSHAVVSWFRYMMANSRSFHIQRLGREFSQIINAENDGATIDHSKVVNIKNYSFLEKYPEYKEALTILNSAFDAINTASTVDPEMSVLDSYQIELHTCLASILEGTDITNRIFICPYCKSLKILKSGVKECKHCESTECENQYNAQRQKEWRLSQQSNSKAIWLKAFEGKPKNCKGSECNEEGGRLRQVNDDCLCRECFRKLNRG